MTRKAVYGKVKQALVEGHAAGLSYAETVAKYGVRRASLYVVAKRLGIFLKQSKHTK